MPKTKADHRSEALRERVQRGAAIAFGKLGYANTRIEDIAECAGVSRPTVYKVFADKDAAFVALSEIHHATIRERLAEVHASTNDPTKQLERGTEKFLRWRAEHGPLGRVIDLEARLPGTRLARDRERTLDFVTGLIQKGLVQAGLPPVDDVLLRAVVAASEHVADELFSKTPVSERVLQRAKAIVLRIYAGVLVAPGSVTSATPRARGQGT